MIVDESTLSLIFWFINLAVLVGLSVYLFMRYGIVPIKRAIVEQQQVLRNILARQRVLKTRYQELERMAVQQQKTFDVLHSKVDIWRRAVDRQQNEVEQQRVVYLNALETRDAQRREHIKNRWLEKQIIPKALDMAHHQLMDMFTKNGQADAYVRTVLDKLKG